MIQDFLALKIRHTLQRLPKSVQSIATLAALLLVAALLPLSEEARGEADFYVLALSWSPAFCALKGYDAPREQCDVREPFRFIVHGLWPQDDEKRLANCPNPQGRLSERIEDSMRDIMPSAGLIQHQWRKHGTCSGLDQQGYFALTRKAYEKIKIPQSFESMAVAFRARPEAIERAFIDANPGLQANQIAIICESATFREVRICLDGDLNFKSCPAIDRNGCQGRPIGVIAP